MFHLKRLTNFCPHDVGHYLGKLRNKTSCKICEKCTQFKEPLIPNVHYIPFDGISLPEKLDGLIKKWEEVKNNYEFLEYIGDNAREWYLRNAKLDSQINLFINSINLNILK